MKKFQVFRYLQKWKYLIFTIAVIGSLAVYWYGQRNQEYTASAIMQYTNSDAEDGLNPDGSPIDTSKITSAAVITDTISDLGLDTNVESIRSKCSVSEIIPSDETERKAALLEKGEEYVYNPTTYEVNFTVGSSGSKDYARDVLDSILTNYFTLYCEKYIDYAVFPNNASNVSTDKYDYIECVEILESTADEIIYYLESRADLYPNFRSAVTGYSFADLKDCYEDIRNNDLLGLHAYILNNQLVQNRELLLRKYENSSAQYQIKIANSTTHIAEAKELLDKFGDKTLSENDKNYTFGGGNGANDGLILNNLEEDRQKSSDIDTTYDQLITNYVNLQANKISYEISLENCQEILSIYSSGVGNTDPSTKKAEKASEDIDRISGELNELYALVLPTIDEYNQRNGANNLAMLSSIAVSEKINLNIYLALAILFFLIMGCFVAVFCGRMGDFVEYFMYTDPKTGLPNRSRCDLIIEHYEEHPLPREFTCVVFKMNLRYPDPDFGRKEGDLLLGKFSSFLKHTFENVTFLGYNNDGMFIAYIEHCKVESAKLLAERVEGLVDNYNASGAKFPIQYTVGISETADEEIFSARELLRTSIRKTLKPKKEEA